MQNRGISGPKIGHVYVSSKNLKNKAKQKHYRQWRFARRGNLNLSIKFTVRVPGDGERGGDSSGPASAAGVQPYPGGSRGHVGTPEARLNIP